jgi:hypothetical protein
VRFKNVVLCDSPSCGAILRINGHVPALSVQIEEDRSGEYFVCPRCGVRTYLALPQEASATTRQSMQPPLRS